jgi:hypothetical protein
MKIIKTSVAAVALVTTVLAVSACADGYSDGYGYSSMSVGVTSTDGYRDDRYYRGRDRDLDGVPNRYDRDRDGDGVPNRFDDRPNNPYRD